jgi:hypothetical protein
MAAAHAKYLLLQIPPSRVEAERPLKEVPHLDFSQQIRLKSKSRDDILSDRVL